MRRPRRPNEVVSRDTVIRREESDTACLTAVGAAASSALKESFFQAAWPLATAILLLRYCCSDIATPAEERALHCLQAGYRLRYAKSLPQARPARQPHSMHCFPGPLKQKGRRDGQGTRKMIIKN